ncbi:hypothetical protein LOK49_LG14G00648 [Camellia lanceoleosa]|uniref:Uncharacterized protein n=1 Tax=Camellia lanceoleosa TaxID=1840588 RepID=A0ACC0FBZ3_9ERIC|nr:hypothetical protein LOK49_LG14G00648 [Camellia lanceoleosa]
MWSDFQIRYAFELLTNPLWKRNYDSIDEHIHVLDSIKERYAGTIFSEIALPLLESASFASLLDGMANTGMVELGEVQLATFLAEKTFTGQPSFQNGLPSLIAFPFGCNTANCLIRSEGELSVDAVTNWFGVESAPAIVFLKEHGVKPVVYHGPANNSWFVDIMEQNKHQELPQLRSVTSMELGCDARGYSHAGSETAIWIQEALSTVDNDQPSSLAAVALKEKRLTFTWLDGEAQQIIKWISQIIEDGDSRELPFFRAKTPALFPEDADPICYPTPFFKDILIHLEKEIVFHFVLNYLEAAGVMCYIVPNLEI